MSKKLKLPKKQEPVEELPKTELPNYTNPEPQNTPKEALSPRSEKQPEQPKLQLPPDFDVLTIDLFETFIPNQFLVHNALSQLTAKVKIVDENLNLAQKFFQEFQTTLQHEFTTNLQTTTSELTNSIMPSSSQPQIFAPISTFRDKDGLIINSEAFPLGNSSKCDFGNERITIFDKKENVEKYYLMIEISQIPSWNYPQPGFIGYAFCQISKMEPFYKQKIEMSVYKYKQGKIQQEIREYVQINGQNVDYQNFQSFEKIFDTRKLRKAIGQINIRVGFIPSAEYNMSQNNGGIQLCPFSQEASRQKFVEETDKQDSESVVLSDRYQILQQIDPFAKQYMDELHNISQNFFSPNITFDQQLKQFTQNVPNKLFCSQFTSNSISALANAKCGNIALSAAAILVDSGLYSIVLYNCITSQLLIQLGTHFGYVYKLAFSDCGNYLASCSADGTVIIFNVSSFVFYGFHFWKQFSDITNAVEDVKKVLENSTQNQLSEVVQNFIQHKVPGNFAYCYGSISRDVECLSILTKQIKSVGSNLNQILDVLDLEIQTEIQNQLQVYLHTEGLCVYDMDFLHLQQQHVLVSLIQSSSLDQRFNLQDFKLLICGLSCNLTLIKLEQQKITSHILSRHNNYINALCVEDIGKKQMIVTADNQGLVKFTLIDGDSVEEKRVIQLMVGLRSILALRTKKNTLNLLVQSGFGQVYLYDDRGVLLQDFDLPVHRTLLPGGCKMTKIQQIGYFSTYGGNVYAVTSLGRILQKYNIFGQETGGCVPSCVSTSQLCIVTVGFNSINSSTLEQYNPQMYKHIASYPIAVIGVEASFKIINWQIVKTHIDQNSVNQNTLQSQTFDDAPDNVEEDVKEVDNMIQEYIQYIQNQNMLLK